MKKKHKKILKINFVSLFFTLVSLLSVTLAWFAYSGLLEASLEIDVKSWFIELEKDGETVSNNIVINSSNIFPGMDIVDETIKIKNLGDSDAQIKYQIKSVRILDEIDHYYETSESLTSEDIETKISHDYPFKINMNLKKTYILAKGDETTFQVTISWPLDSGDDMADSYWGNKAYEFNMQEKNKKEMDDSYQMKTPIEVIISVVAEQYLEEDESSDYRFNLGDEILFDVVQNKTCFSIDGNCYKGYILDVNNKNNDDVVTLILDPKSTYVSSNYNNFEASFSNLTSSWVVNKRKLTIEDLLKIVSTNIIDSKFVREDLSDSIIGNLKKQDIINNQISNVVSYNGYYKFLNTTFEFLVSNNCYLINSEYDANNYFAYSKTDEFYSKIGPKLKASICNIVPVIEVNKSDI